MNDEKQVRFAEKKLRKEKTNNLSDHLKLVIPEKGLQKEGKTTKQKSRNI